MRPAAIAAVAVAGIAIFLRLWNFADGRSLWHDEAMLAVSLVTLSPGALLRQLEFDQIAPIGWLMLEKASLLLSADFDYSLRLLSLLGGIATLLWFWKFVHGQCRGWEAAAALALFGLSSALIQYSSMVKPYVFDALFSVIMLDLGARLLAQPGDLRRTALVGLAGLLCIPTAFGGSIVMAATGAVLFARAITLRDRRWVIALAVMGIVWIAAFFIIYQLTYAAQSTTVGNMKNVYWLDAFAPLPTSLQAIEWYPRKLLHAANFLVAGSNSMLIVGLFLLGTAAIARRNPWLAVLLLAPFAMALLASGARAYPFESRFLLFLAPQLCFGVVHGAAIVVGALRNSRIVAIAIAVLVGAGAIGLTAVRATRQPAWPIEEIKQNMAVLDEKWRPSELLMLNQAAERPYLLYAPRFGLADRSYAVAHDYRIDKSCAEADLARLGEVPVAWLLFYHVRDAEQPALIHLIQRLSERGSIKIADNAPGSILYRYQAEPHRKRPPTPPGAVNPECLEQRKGVALLEHLKRTNQQAVQAE